MSVTSPKHDVAERVRLKAEALKCNTEVEVLNQNTKVEALKKEYISKSAEIKQEKRKR